MRPQDSQAKQLKDIERVLPRLASRLRLPEVLGLGIGFRRRKGRVRREPVLTVYVVPGRKRKKKADVPRHRRIPSVMRATIRGRTIVVPVDIVARRPAVLHAATLQSGQAVANTLTLDNLGSIGWIGEMLDGRPVVCTAYHAALRADSLTAGGVVERRYEPRPGDPVEHVTTGDGWSVGIVTRAVRNNVCDAACIAPAPGVVLQRSILNVGQPVAVRLLDPGELDIGREAIRVQYVGQVSGWRSGVVTAMAAQRPFAYDDFPNGLLMMDLIEARILSQPGDSGAVLLDMKRHPLGLLLGGDDTHSYFIHIKHVIKQLKLGDPES